MSMSLGKFLFQICRNIFSFLSYRINKEYEYIFSSGERHGVEGSVRGDIYVQRIVDNLTKERGDEYDPYIIEDKLYTWLRIPLIAEVQHLKTFVNGLKSLHKEETCEIIEKDSQLYVNATLGAGRLHFNIFAFAKLAYIEQLITIEASLNYCKVNVNFSIDTETGRNRSLQSLCIEDLSDVNIFISGFGCFSWLSSKLVTLMMKLNHRLVRNLVEFGIERYVSQFFPGYPFPTEDEYIMNASTSKNYGALGNADKSLKESLSAERKEQFMPNNSRNINKLNPEHQTDSGEHPSEDASIASKLEKDFWYTNVPLLRGNAVSQGHNANESNADDVQIEFQFSKNDVLSEDVEPLAKPDMSTCCVFFRSETDYLNNLAVTETGKYLPFKHSTDFLKGLQTTCEASDIGGGSILSEELDKSYVNVEKARSCNERLMKNFVKYYPNFITLKYNLCEEQKQTDDSIEEFNSSAEAKVCENKSEGPVESQGNVKVNLASTAGSRNEVTFHLNRAFGYSNELSKTVPEPPDFQNSTTKPVQCVSLPMDSTFDHNGNEKSTMPNEIYVQEVTSFQSMKDICNDAISEALQKDELIYALTKDSDGKDHGVVEQVQNAKQINIVQNIESILKWNLNSENIEESKCLGTKKSRFQSKETSQLFMPGYFNVSKVIPDKSSKIRKRSKNMKDNLYGHVSMKENENKDVAHKEKDMDKGRILRNSVSLRRENVTEYIQKYKCTSIEQLNAIEDTICKCFENPWMETVPENTFFFNDSESDTIFDLNKRQKSELADQLDLLEDIKVEELRKETDHFEINLDIILKEAETKFFDASKNNNQTTELNLSLQSDTTNAKTFDISKLVQNFFEQNPIQNIKFKPKKIIHPHIGEDNKSINESSHLSLKEIINISVSPKVDYCSNIIKDPLSDLIHKPLEESSASLEVRKFDPSSNNSTGMVSDTGTQSEDSTINDELDWSDIVDTDETCDSSFSSYVDITNISRNLSEYGLSEKYNLVPEMDSLNKNKTDVIDRQSTEAYSSTREEIIVSDNSSLKMDISKGSPDKVTEKLVVETEKIQTKLGEVKKTTIPEEQIVSIKETKIPFNTDKNEFVIKTFKPEQANIEEQNAKYTCMSNLCLEKYNNVSEDIYILPAKSNYALNLKDGISKDLLSLDGEKQNKDCTNIVEKIQISKDKQVEKDTRESLAEQLNFEKSDDFSTTQDKDFEDTFEQTNKLRSMFEELVRQRDEGELNLFTEANGQEPYSRNLIEQSAFKNENIRKIPINMDKYPLIESPDKSRGSISFVESAEDLWKETVIVDVNGGVSWKKAREIWGCGQADSSF